ncbi:hypothetical protein [Limibacterium fermenti]|uniref:hypothetical protein n=1 Tax=Limibacterium fermenti TaxID=3229863 RepID=UPI000E7DF89F|nr:hypothetical protein [Porphyromonadaceae bacterium]
MLKLIARILIAVILSIGMASIGVNGNVAVLQTLFTVLGIVFSISMSLLVSFSLIKILNKKIRKKLRSSISQTRNMLLLDFGVSTIALVIALIWNTENLRYTFGWCTIDVLLIAVTIVSLSLIYETYNFRKIHALNTDIEDTVIEEENNRSKL